VRDQVPPVNVIRLTLVPRFSKVAPSGPSVIVGDDWTSAVAAAFVEAGAVRKKILVRLG